MYSFYGGRPGNSFIIITTYESVTDMVTNFKLGPDYSAVHYDEHVMINTVNKNDPDNGKIYRRGYDFNNDMGGAEYIGTVVGPAGRAPMLKMTTIADVAAKHAAEGFDERRSSGQYILRDGNLVPGKTKNGEYNDAITWACYSMRNENDEDSTAYIGFIFPYPVIEFETESISSYDENTGEYIDTSSADRTDEEDHPFYEKWNFKIPKGIKGDSIKNLKVETASNNIQDYNGRTDDINGQRQVLTYEYYNYDNNINGNPVKYYLGDYNMINDIEVTNEGTINISYTHNDSTTLTNKIKWITGVSLNPNNGTFIVNFNSGSPFQTTLDWVKDINLSDDGIMTFYHTGSQDSTKSIKWINSVSLNTNTGLFEVTYNQKDNQGNNIKYNTYLDWIKGINIANDGTVTVQHSHGNDTTLSNKIKWVKNLAVQTESGTSVDEGSGDQKLYVTWNDDSSQAISDPINYIMDMAVDDTNRLLVRYSDPNRRIAGITFNQIQGWTSLGTIAQETVYGSGSSASGLNWIGIGQLIDPGNSSSYKKIKFTITPTAIINASNIVAQSGTLKGSFGNDITFSSNNTQITKTLFGLQFEVETTIASSSSSTESTSFINLSISNLNLSFN